MDTQKPSRTERLEGVARSMLGAALIIALMWALTDGSDFNQKLANLGMRGSAAHYSQ